MKPLLGTTFPPSLRALHDKLHESDPILESLPECLIALYEQPNSKLNYHVDVGGIRYWKIPEYIVLLFHGFPRALKFRPNIECKPHIRSLDPILNLEVSLKCHEHIMIHITPIANIMFEHSKAKCTSKDPSVTLAFRRGVPLKSAKGLYPHLRKYKSLAQLQ